MGEIVKFIVKCWKLLLVLIPIGAVAWGIYSLINGREIQSLPLPDLYPTVGR